MTNTIGETLSRERVRQNLTLQQVSESTKIGTRLLRAVETGEFHKLPGGVFTRSFIKQYAAALGIDATYVDAELRNLQLESEENRTEGTQAGYTFPVDQVSSTEPSTLLQSAVWVALALLVCGGVYYVMNRAEKGGQSAVPKSSVVMPKPEETPKPVESKRETAPSPAATVPAVQTLGSGPLQVVLNASEDSWVSVSVDGRQVFSGLLHPNDKKEINAADRVKVVAGNAGGLDIQLNGKPIDTLGPKGQVRTVELTRAGAQVVSRTPKPAPLL